MTTEARGQGRGVGGPAQGDGGATFCVCPSCGHRETHVRGTPCQSQPCPKCKVAMVGEEDKDGPDSFETFKKKMRKANPDMTDEGLKKMWDALQKSKKDQKENMVKISALMPGDLFFFENGEPNKTSVSVRNRKGEQKVFVKLEGGGCAFDNKQGKKGKTTANQEVIPVLSVEAALPAATKLSMSDQVDMNTQAKAGKNVKLTSSLYDTLVKKYGKGNNVTITKKSVALGKQKIEIHKPKGRMGSTAITLSPAGNYIKVHTTDGSKAESKFILIPSKMRESLATEVFGPSRIGCDALDCVSNTGRKCQASSVEMIRRECKSYRIRANASEAGEKTVVQNVKTGDSINIDNKEFYRGGDNVMYEYFKNKNNSGFVKKVTDQYIVADFGSTFSAVTLWYGDPWSIVRREKE